MREPGRDLVSHDPPFAPAWLPFDHPLWVVYSSGTTGLPKPIVHGHGGVMIEALKAGALHNDVDASHVGGDRYHWYSATGWIMWNSQVGALLGGATICIYDGNPGGSSKTPDPTTLWRFAADPGVTFFGAGEVGAARDRLDRLAARDRRLRVDLAQMPRVDGERIWLTPIAGKKRELPVKKLLMGTPADQVFNIDAMGGAESAAGCVAWFVEFAAKRASASC